ncbi:uncharacterized protein LOC111295624 [Durio zibethinus]|uniref:Uncharacterized protein LOC111295624 n=1 Tax=Durio zibethinus TaxID=66656 RepID=A0A6P5YWM8_DURZI|nr:uncharacterized protein LOC111295624 [Durio zibethinus]
MYNSPPINLSSLENYDIYFFFCRAVDMKEKNTSSPLRRVLVNCTAQAKQCGACVAAKVREVERDMCFKEFLALKTCMQNTLRGKA